MAAREKVLKATAIATEMGYVRSSYMASYMAERFYVRTAKNLLFSKTYLYKPSLLES